MLMHYDDIIIYLKKKIISFSAVSQFMVQGGDFISDNGSKGESIYGSIFDDENFILEVVFAS